MDQVSTDPSIWVASLPVIPPSKRGLTATFHSQSVLPDRIMSFGGWEVPVSARADGALFLSDKASLSSKFLTVGIKKASLTLFRDALLYRLWQQAALSSGSPSAPENSVMAAREQDDRGLGSSHQAVFNYIHLVSQDIFRVSCQR